MRLLIQPLLLAIYPAIFLFNRNIGEALAWDFLSVSILSCIIVIACFFISKKLFHNDIKAAIYTNIFVALTFYFGLLVEGLECFSILGLNPFRWRYILPIYLVILIFLFVKLHKSNIKSLFFTKFLIIPMLILYTFLVLQIFIGFYQIHSLITSYEQKNQIFLKQDFNITTQGSDSPSVYHIILDRYPSKEVLKRVFDYDNSDFINHLKRLGFALPSKSYSNYNATGYSIPATMNMNYHDFGYCSDRIYSALAYHMIRNNNVTKFFKQLGYDYKHVASYYPMFQEPPYTSYNVELSFFEKLWHSLTKSQWVISTFLVSFFKNTILAPFWERYIYEPKCRKIILNQLKELKSSVEVQKPHFIFAHMLCPHPPCLFDSEGNAVAIGYSDKQYIEQIKFINKRILDVIIHIIDNKESIIILQSDHGVVAKSEEDLFGILNAYYLPGSIKPHDTISPINNFRFIFDNYFNTNFGLLPDKSYLPAWEDWWSFFHNNTTSKKDVGYKKSGSFSNVDPFLRRSV